MFSLKKLLLPILFATPLLAMQKPEIAQQFDMSAVPAETACNIAKMLAQAQTPEYAVKNLKALACTSRYFANLLHDNVFTQNYLAAFSKFFNISILSAGGCYLRTICTQSIVVKELEQLETRIQKISNLPNKPHLVTFRQLPDGSLLVGGGYKNSAVLFRLSGYQNAIDPEFFKYENRLTLKKITGIVFCSNFKLPDQVPVTLADANFNDVEGHPDLIRFETIFKNPDSKYYETVEFALDLEGNCRGMCVGSGIRH